MEKLSNFDAIIGLQEDLPMCSCGREKVRFVCKKDTCDDRAQLLYCEECTGKDDKHDHKPVNIHMERTYLETKWSLMKKNMEKVLQVNRDFMEKRLELIDYIHSDPAASKVKANLALLKDQSSKMASLMPEYSKYLNDNIEPKIKLGKILELYKQESDFKKF